MRYHKCLLPQGPPRLTVGCGKPCRNAQVAAASTDESTLYVPQNSATYTRAEPPAPEPGARELRRLQTSYRTLTFSAFSPLGPVVTSSSTSWPS